jgi:hypothetical protein
VGNSATRPHGAATLPVQEDDSAGGNSATGGNNLMLLLPVCHHMEVLDTVVTPDKLEEINRVVGFAASIGQTH